MQRVSMVVSYLRDSVSVWQKWALPGNIENMLDYQLAIQSNMTA